MIKAYKIQIYMCKGCPLSNLSLLLRDPLLIHLKTALYHRFNYFPK